MTYPKTEYVLAQCGNSIVSALNEYLSSKHGVSNSGITYLVSLDSDGDIQLYINAADYVHFLDTGRAPGKQPPLSKIQTWTQKKGIPLKAAFPIARHIGKYGIPAGDFYDDIVDGIINKYQPKIDEAVEEDLADFLNNNI